MQPRRGRLSGDDLHPALGHREQILTNLLEGRLGNLALEPEQVRQSQRLD